MDWKNDYVRRQKPKAWGVFFNSLLKTWDTPR